MHKSRPSPYQLTAYARIVHGAIAELRLLLLKCAAARRLWMVLAHRVEAMGEQTLESGRLVPMRRRRLLGVRWQCETLGGDGPQRRRRQRQQANGVHYALCVAGVSMCNQVYDTICVVRTPFSERLGRVRGSVAVGLR